MVDNFLAKYKDESSESSDDYVLSRDDSEGLKSANKYNTPQPYTFDPSAILKQYTKPKQVNEITSARKDKRDIKRSIDCNAQRQESMNEVLEKLIKELSSEDLKSKMVGKVKERLREVQSGVATLVKEREAIKEQLELNQIKAKKLNSACKILKAKL